MDLEFAEVESRMSIRRFEGDLAKTPTFRPERLGS
jgi:hypothetical protein